MRKLTGEHPPNQPGAESREYRPRPGGLRPTTHRLPYPGWRNLDDGETTREQWDHRNRRKLEAGPGSADDDRGPVIAEAIYQLDALVEIDLPSREQGDPSPARAQLIEGGPFDNEVGEGPGAPFCRDQIDDQRGADSRRQTDRRHGRQDWIRRPHTEHGMSPLPTHAIEHMACADPEQDPCPAPVPWPVAQ